MTVNNPHGEFGFEREMPGVSSDGEEVSVVSPGAETLGELQERATGHLETAANVYGILGEQPGDVAENIAVLVGEANDNALYQGTPEARDEAIIADEVAVEGMEGGHDVALLASALEQQAMTLGDALREVAVVKGDAAVEKVIKAIDDVAENRQGLHQAPGVAHDTKVEPRESNENEEQTRSNIGGLFEAVLNRSWAYGNVAVELQRLQQTPDEMSEDEVRHAAQGLRTMRAVQSIYRGNVVGMRDIDTLTFRAAAYEGEQSLATSFGKDLLSDRPDEEAKVANILLQAGVINEDMAAQVAHIVRSNENEAQQQFDATDFSQLGEKLNRNGAKLRGQLWRDSADRRQTLAEVAQFANTEIPAGLKDKVTKLLFSGDTIRLDYLPQFEAALAGGLVEGLSEFQAVTGKDKTEKYIEGLVASDRKAIHALLGNLTATELYDYFPNNEDGDPQAFSQIYKGELIDFITRHMTEAGSVTSKVGEVKRLEVDGIEQVIARPVFNGADHKLLYEILRSENAPERYDKLRTLLENGFVARLLADESLGSVVGADIANELVDWIRLSENIPNNPDMQVTNYVINRLQRTPLIERIVDSMGALHAFYIPETYSDEVARSKTLELVRSVLGLARVDKLPTRVSKLRLLIEDERLRAAYLHIVGTKASSPEMSADEILRIGVEQGVFDEATMTELTDGLVQDVSEQTDVTSIFSELGNLSEKRKSIKGARTRWLGEGAKNDTLTSKLKLAWSYREDALAEGARDVPGEILSWAAAYAFERYTRQRRAENPDIVLPSEEEMITYKPITSELVRRYSPDVSLQAFMRYKTAAEHGFNGLPDLKAGKAEVVSDDGSRYSFELLEKSDSRGFTIGVDTGCCMTLGGAAEDCVWAGYEDPSFGFIAVYKDGRLRGQSVVYVGDKTGEGLKDTLVLDNIEANKGTDMTNLIGVYQQGLKKLFNQGALRSSIKQINLGTGFSDVDFGDLEVAEPVYHYKPVYTDAENQRVLLSI